LCHAGNEGRAAHKKTATHLVQPALTGRDILTGCEPPGQIGQDRTEPHAWNSARSAVRVSELKVIGEGLRFQLLRRPGRGEGPTTGKGSPSQGFRPAPRGKKRKQLAQHRREGGLGLIFSLDRPKGARPQALVPGAFRCVGGCKNRQAKVTKRALPACVGAGCAMDDGTSHPRARKNVRLRPGPGPASPDHDGRGDCALTGVCPRWPAALHKLDRGKGEENRAAAAGWIALAAGANCRIDVSQSGRR